MVEFTHTGSFGIVIILILNDEWLEICDVVLSCGLSVSISLDAVDLALVILVAKCQGDW